MVHVDFDIPTKNTNFKLPQILESFCGDCEVNKTGKASNEAPLS